MNDSISRELRIAVQGEILSNNIRFVNSIAGAEIIPEDFVHAMTQTALTFCVHFISSAQEIQIFVGDEEISYDIFLEIWDGKTEDSRWKNVDVVDFHVPTGGALDNICLVVNEKDFSAVNALILTVSALLMFTKDFAMKINQLHRKNPSLVEQAMVVVFFRNMQQEEIAKRANGINKHISRFCYQSAPNAFFVSSIDNGSFEKIRLELSCFRMKKALELAFKKLPEIIYSLNDAKADSYLQKLAALEKRYRDPEFLLAIIGNYSCGKSTFLNALVGRELLSTSFLPTTAIPTYIRWNRNARLKDSHDSRKYYNPIVEITMSDGKSYVMTKEGMAQLEKNYDIELPDDIGEMIDRLTTTDELIGKIKRVELSFPEREGFENFCLIDTPGMNPGDEEKREHILQSQSVLLNEADAAIVLYAAKDAMSHDMQEFMEENAMHLMQGAIIVLTKMDLVPAGQYKKILKNTAKQVQLQFHQKNPRVYDISAQQTLEFISGRSTKEEDETWARRFNETISDIIGQLSMRRAAIVSRRTAALMVELAESVSKIISTETDTLNAESESLKKAAVENMEEEFRVLNAEYERMLSAGSSSRQNSVKAVIRREVASGRENIISSINAASDVDELKRCIEVRYPLIMRYASNKITDVMKTEILPQITSLAEEYAQKVGECLKKYHRYLGKVETHEIQVHGSMVEGISVTPDIQIDNSFTEKNAALLTSIAASLILGPLALVGGYFLDKFRFSTKKDDAKTAVYEKLEEYEDQLIDKSFENLRRIENQNLKWARDLLEAYRKNYSEDFNRIETIHKKRVHEVEEQIAYNRQKLQFIQSLKEGLT